MSTMKVTTLKNESSSVDQIVLNADGSFGGELGTTLAAKAATADLAFTRIVTVTASASSAVYVNNCFSAAYDFYRIELFGTMSSANTELWMRMRSSGIDLATGTPYLYGGAYHLWATATMAALGTAAANQWRVGFVSSAANPVAKVIEVAGPFLTEQTRFVSLGPDEDTNITYTGRLANANSYDGFSLIPASGTLTVSLSVYGYKK